MTAKSLLKGIGLVALMLSTAMANAQQSEKLPIKSDQVTIGGRSVNEPLPQKAQVVLQSSMLQLPTQGASTLVSTSDILVNNNNGATGAAGFTQSETSVIAFGNNIVVGYNDAGSNATGNHFTGWSYSADGGATFTDGGVLPASAAGDAGDPVLARNKTTGRIYLVTLGYINPDVTQVFHSDDNAVSWSAPVNGTPGGDIEDKPWVDVDNFAGSGNGNIYLLSRRFGVGGGIYFFRSTDNGATFGPTGGTLIVSGSQGAYIAVGPDHSVYAFYWAGSSLRMRRSTDQGLTFGAPVTIATLTVGGINGDLGLTGIRNGLATSSTFRTSKFPHAAVNPVSGHIYVTYSNDPAGADKADVFYTMSTNNGASWSAPVRINDDATTTDQWQPTVAISPNGLQIGFFYYSRQEDAANNNLFKYYGRTGSISGATVTLDPSFAVSDAASPPEFGRDAFVNSTYMGDYNTASATSSHFNVVWSDSRNDLAGGSPRKDPNVYFKKISLPALDTEPPVITCPDGITSANDAGLCSKLLSVGTATASDNNGTVTITGVRSDALALNAPYPVGTTTILWTATDPSDNSASCTQSIIVNDHELPDAQCKNITVTLLNGSATITAAEVNNSSKDNCAIKSITVSNTIFGCADVGNKKVTLTVTDIHDNVSTCTAIVTVVGEAPTCSILAIPENNIYTGGAPTTIYLGYGPQKATLQVPAPASGAPYTYLWSGGALSSYNTYNPVFAPTTAGTYTFSVTITNKYGCTATCSITLHVYDIRVPGSNGKKVYVCHVPGGKPDNAHTIAISVNAVASHVPGHGGDHLGSCDCESDESENINMEQWDDRRFSSMATPYPNPNNGTFDLLLNNFKYGKAEIRIMNKTGAVIERISIQLSGKVQVVHFNLKNLSAGIYYVQIVTNEGIQNSKVVINR